MCALCETFFTQESFRGRGARNPTTRVCRAVPAIPCRVAPRPCTPGLLSSREESNQRRAKEEVSSLETPLRGRPHPYFSCYLAFLCAVPRMKQVSFSELLHSNGTPSGTSRCEALSPWLLRQREVARPLACRFGQQVGTSNAGAVRSSAKKEVPQESSCKNIPSPARILAEALPPAQKNVKIMKYFKRRRKGALCFPKRTFSG